MSIDDEGSISVVLLSYNRPKLLHRALESIKRQTLRPSEVIIIDNISQQSKEVERIMADYPEYFLRKLSTNLGFSGGMNLGLQSCDSDYVFITEDDLILDVDCLRQLATGSPPPSIPALTAPLLIDEETNSIWCNGGTLQLDNPSNFQISRVLKPSVGDPSLRQVEFIPGSAIFWTRAAINALTGFQQEFFAYWEDVELCIRARRHRIPLMVNTFAQVIHITPRPGIATEPAAVTYHKEKNFLAVMTLHSAGPVLVDFLCRRMKWMAFTAMKDRTKGRINYLALRWYILNLNKLLRKRRRQRISPAP